MKPWFFKENTRADKTRSTLIIIGVGILVGAAIFGLTSLVAPGSSIGSRWATAGLAFVSTILALTAFTEVTKRRQQILVVGLSIAAVFLGVLALTV